MNVTLKRWVKVLLVVAAVPLVAAGVLYVVLVNNLKDVIRYGVETGTKGGYAFQSKDVRLSLWDKTVVLDEVTLTRKDTANVPVYYNVRIPKAYLSIDSWQELVANKRLSVDSFAIVKPDIAIHDYRVHKAQHPQHATGFRTTMILENLQKTLDHLHARSFSIRQAAFTMHTRTGQAPFAVKDLSLSVRNFLKIDNNDKRLFGSDNIELALGRQRWVLSDGRNTLSFRGLAFSSATQLFEIDSVRFHKPALNGQGGMSLRADKFFFNSRHLPAIYQKGELILDTLECVRPVLLLPLQAKKKQPVDTAGTIHANIQSLFRSVAIRYAEIRDGRIQLGDATNHTASSGTRTANLKIYNLVFHPQRTPALNTDSIRLNMDNIAFYSRDSLFKIAVGSFSLRDKDVFFRNVTYGPARPGRAVPKTTGNGLTFTAPALRLRNISLNDLLHKRLVASDAELDRPTITVLATKKTPATPQTNVAAVTKQTKKDMYQTLHGLADLIEVAQFRVVEGEARYKLGAEKPVDVAMTGLNATILLKDLLQSDSLIDIKHAIPTLTIRDVNVAANGLKLALNRYHLDGKQRRNWLNRVRMELPTGTTVTGNDLYWEAFSWDVLQQTKTIQIDLLRAGNLAVEVKAVPKKTVEPAGPPQPSVAAATPKKPLPRLHIGRLIANRLTVEAKLPDQTLAGFTGEGIRVDKLTTDASHFRWALVSGNLDNVQVNQPGGRQVAIAHVALNSAHTSTLTNLRYDDNRPGQTKQVSLPQIRLAGPFSSTDFSVIHLRSLELDQPELTMETEARPKPAGAAKPFAIPLNLAVDELAVQGARVNYITRNGPKTTSVQTQVDVVAKTLHSRKHGSEGLTFASLRVSPHNAKVTANKLNVSLPTAHVQLSNGRLSASSTGKPALTAHLLADWTINDLHPVLTSKKSTAPPELRVKGINGAIDMPHFAWTAGQKLSWPALAERTSIAITDLFFRSATTAVHAEKVTWEPTQERLQLANFRVAPTITKEEFMTPPRLQADYITVQGDLAQLNGIKLARWSRDSVLAIGHIIVKNVSTDVSRDKRLPDPAVLPVKLMPTRLIGRVKVPFQIDSVVVISSDVTYHETSKVTGRVGSIPLRNINGTLRQVTNRPTKPTDSLKLAASTSLLGLHIQRLHYRESYGDSLAGFHMFLRTSGLNLPELTPITNPMAAADLDAGYVHPIMARIAGNKYASVGHMRFHYNDLKVRLLGHVDTTRKTLLIKFENFVVGKVLRKKNDQDSRIFYDRDQKKFIFGYWIKSIMSGVLTSVGVKGNKKYHANYLRAAQMHQLPPEEQ